MGGLVKYEPKQDIVEYAEKQIASFQTIDELRQINDQAMALHLLAKESREPRTVLNGLISVAAFSRRRAGELLGPGGIVRRDVGRYPNGDKLSLLNLGIDKKEASRWMMFAKVPKEKWDEYFRQTDIITFSGIYKLARKLIPLESIKGEYDVIIIDPPWDIEKIDREVAPRQADEGIEYDTMTIDEIKDFEIPSAEDTHLFLWTTQRFLPTSFEILNAWEARYVCTFGWHKPGGFQVEGLPQYNCEFVLYGRIGKPIFTSTKGLMTCFSAPRGDHSEKPDLFYEMIKNATRGERIDIFARRKHEGYKGWGLEYE